MARLLLNLRHVPDDEAEEVRALLTTAGIEYYETEPNRWGISAGGIWIRHEADAAKANHLLNDYQQDRRARARAAYEAARRNGTLDSFWSVARSDPRRIAVTIAAIIAVLALSAVPFLMLLR